MTNIAEKIRIRKLPPVWFIRGINAIRSALLILNRKMFPANVVLYEYFQYFWLLPCIRVAAELNIAGLLKKCPLTLGELSEKTGSHADSLGRMLRALAGCGIFRQRKDGRYSNTSLSKVLIDGKGSLRYMILHHLGPVNWNLFSQLSHKVKTGEDVFLKVYSKHIYEYLAEDKNESFLFDRSMTDLSEMAVEPMLSVYNFSDASTVADIGGGEGILLSSILYNYKNLKGILFDLPEAMVQSSAILEKYGVSDRTTVIPGSFFDKVPTGADLYLLKNIVHNWSDDDCLKILKMVRDVLPDHGKIILVEMVIEEDNRPSFGKLIDVQMMVVMRDGRERTRKEFNKLLQNAGLKLNRVIPTIAPFSLIEAVKQ